jgi:hypothetical protein
MVPAHYKEPATIRITRIRSLTSSHAVRSFTSILWKKNQFLGEKKSLYCGLNEDYSPLRLGGSTICERLSSLCVGVQLISRPISSFLSHGPDDAGKR